MSVLDKLACRQNRKDELPNIELARELTSNADRKGIREIADNLWNDDKNIQGDCIKVLYEIGYGKPELISDHVSEFIKLLSSKNNRLAWGGMIALATISHLKPSDIYGNIDAIIKAMKSGSVITVDNAIKVLAKVASMSEKYNEKLLPLLIEHLENCRPKELAQHAESVLCAVTDKNRKRYVDILAKRHRSLVPSQQSRINRIMKKFKDAEIER